MEVVEELVAAEERSLRAGEAVQVTLADYMHHGWYLRRQAEQSPQLGLSSLRTGSYGVVMHGPPA